MESPLIVDGKIVRHTFVSVKARQGEMDRYSKSSMAARQRWVDKYAAHMTEDCREITTTSTAQQL